MDFRDEQVNLLSSMTPAPLLFAAAEVAQIV